MGIKVSWANEQKTIVMVKFESGWTWEDFDASVDQSYVLMKECDHPVHVIVDSLEAPMPPSPQVIGHLQRAWMSRPSNFGVQVMVGGESFVNVVANVFSKVFPTAGAVTPVAKTVEDAYAKIAEIEKRQAEKKPGG